MLLGRWYGQPFPSFLATPSFDASFNAIVWQTIPVTGVGWGRRESTALASVFLFFNFHDGAIF